jgi:1-pyrroline-5-carboxylate dehydrogenase
MFLKRVATCSHLLSQRGAQRDFSKILKAFATVDPKNLGP